MQLYGGRVWNVAFELETGSELRCHPTIDHHDFVGVHTGSDCAGPLHTLLQGAASITIDGDQLFYASGEEVPSDFGSSVEGASCDSFSTSTRFYELMPAPEEVFGLLPNPPYALTLESSKG